MPLVCLSLVRFVFGGVIWDGLDLTVDSEIALRIVKHLTVTIELLCIQASELRCAAIADKKRAEDNILDLSLVIEDRSAWTHPIELPLVIANDTDLLFKRIVGLNHSPYRSLKVFQLSTYLCNSGFSSRLTYDHFDLRLK